MTIQEDAKAINEVVAAREKYIAAVKEMFEYEKQQIRLAGPIYDQLQEEEKRVLRESFQRLYDERKSTTDELDFKFADQLQAIRSAGSSPLDTKHHEELKTLKESIEFATKVVSNKSTDLEVFKGFEATEKKLSERYQSLETTAKGKLEWQGIKSGLGLLLGVSLLVAGLALACTGMGMALGLGLIILAIPIIIGTSIKTANSVNTEQASRVRYKSQDTIRSSISTMFNKQRPVKSDEQPKTETSSHSPQKKGT